MSNLQKRKYYYAYPVATYFGKIDIQSDDYMKFVIRDDCPDDNHAHAIDLGLSVKWACCNVGATKPEEYGGYYAWGETEEKSFYEIDHYKWYKGSSESYTKYNNDISYGPVDNKTVLDPEDDVARVRWGGSWRMPTSAECKELIDNCDTEWTTLNGVSGRKFTSRINGNSIFLPVAGFHDYDELARVGSHGSYWSSSLSAYDTDDAYGMYFELDYVQMETDRRFYGQSVRPVFIEEKESE